MSFCCQCLTNVFQLLWLGYQPVIRLTCLLLLNIGVISRTRTYGSTNRMKMLSYKSETTILFVLDKSLRLMREAEVITPVRRYGGTLLIRSLVEGCAVRLSATPLIWIQLIHIFSLLTLTINIPHLKAFRIPTIKVHTVRKFLTGLKRTAPDPNELPFWFWKD